MIPQKDLDLLPPPTTKKITIVQNIKSGQVIVLVDLEPGTSFDIISTHELKAGESYRSFYRKFVASDDWRRLSNQSSSSSQSSLNATPELETPTGTGTNTPMDSQVASSPSRRGEKRKALLGNDSPRKTKNRRTRTQATVPPSTRILRNSS